MSDEDWKFSIDESAPKKANKIDLSQKSKTTNRSVKLKLDFESKPTAKSRGKYLEDEKNEDESPIYSNIKFYGKKIFWLIILLVVGFVLVKYFNLL